MVSYRFEKLSPRVLLHGGTIGVDLSSDVVEAAPVVAEMHHEETGPHPDDPVRAGEHAALLALVPHDQATHVAAADGDWTDPATWAGGEVPGDGAHVLIPHGTGVVIDGVLSARLATVRVDGALSFAADADTHLAVDTLVINSTGALRIGTADEPIAPGVSASVLFTDSGAIDTAWDPTLLSRGLVSHGEATIHGADKGAPIDLATAPTAGDTELRLATPAEGWLVGDRVLVPGVVRPAENNKGVTLLDQDEVVTVTAISEDGTRVTLDRALSHDHVPPQAGLTVPVANLDRNVVFSSENTTDPSRAGHVMFMHSPDVSVSHAALRHIGRNDKTVPTTDPQLDEHGVLIPGTGDNPRGRYAVHFHRTGSESVAATVTGAVVENSPGWGFVNHDSHVVVRESVSYNVKGAGFVTETGSERGAFLDNLAVRSTGKNFYQPMGASDKDQGAGFGSAGHGFWLQSASVAMVGNVAAGHAQEGIFINNRLVTEPGRDLPSYASLVDTPAGTPIEFTANGATPTLRDDEIRPEQTPLAEMRGNEVFASGAGMAVRWRRPTFALAEGDDGDVIEDFKIWNVEWAGIHLGYVSGLTLRNGLILGDLADPIELDKDERLDRETETSEINSAAGKGVAANRNSRNLTYENLTVGGFTVGIQALTQSLTRIETAQLQNVENLLVVTPQSTSQSDGVRRIDATGVTNTPLTADALDGATPYNVRMIKQIDRAGVAGGSSPSQEIGAFTATDEVYYNGYRLFFHDQASDAVPFPAGETPRFMNRAPFRDYVGLTNDQLLSEFGVALGGETAPAEAVDAGDLLGANALAVPLAESPATPQRVEFRFDAAGADSDWTLGEEDLAVDWQTTQLDAGVPWRVYLVGADGAQEVARTKLPSKYGKVSAGDDSDGWQSWTFRWPTVGELPPWWKGAVEAGDYSLVAAADDGPSVYLGRIAIAPTPAPAIAFSSAPTDPGDNDSLPPVPVSAVDQALLLLNDNDPDGPLTDPDAVEVPSDDSPAQEEAATGPTAEPDLSTLRIAPLGVRQPL